MMRILSLVMVFVFGMNALAPQLAYAANTGRKPATNKSRKTVTRKPTTNSSKNGKCSTVEKMMNEWANYDWLRPECIKKVTESFLRRTGYLSEDEKKVLISVTDWQRREAQRLFKTNQRSKAYALLEAHHDLTLAITRLGANEFRQIVIDERGNVIKPEPSDPTTTDSPGLTTPTSKPTLPGTGAPSKDGSGVIQASAPWSTIDQAILDNINAQVTKNARQITVPAWEYQRFLKGVELAEFDILQIASYLNPTDEQKEYPNYSSFAMSAGEILINNTWGFYSVSPDQIDEEEKNDYELVFNWLVSDVPALLTFFGQPNATWQEEKIQAVGTLQILNYVINSKYKSKKLDLSGLFMRQIRALKEETFKMDLMVQYAVRYALIADDMNLLEQVKAMLAEGSSAKEKNGTYSGTIETMANTIVDTLLNFPIDDKNAVGREVVNLALRWAEPNEVLDVRVAALEILSLLHKNAKDSMPARDRDPLTNLANKKLAAWDQGGINPKYVFRPVTLQAWELSPKNRDKLAKYVVDIYAPMQNTSLPENYGLSSSQMVAFSNVLTGVYERFLPVVAPETDYNNPNPMNCHYGFIPNHYTLIHSVRTSPVLCYRQDNGSTVTVEPPVYVFDSKNKPIAMYFNNFPNAKKVDKENAALFFSVAKEAALWVFAGELIGVGIKALSMMRGAVTGFPRALTLGKRAYTIAKGNGSSTLNAVGKAFSRGRGAMRQASMYGSELYAGATTLTTAVRTEETVAGKLVDVERTYFGSGNGLSSVLGRKITDTKGTSSIVKRFNQAWTGETPPIKVYRLRGLSAEGLPVQHTISASSRPGLNQGLSWLDKAVLRREAFHAGFDVSANPFTGWFKGLKLREAGSFYAAAADSESFLAGKAGTSFGGANAGTTFDIWGFNVGKGANGGLRQMPQAELSSLAARAKDPEVLSAYLHYNTLGLKPGASLSEIQSAYRRIVPKGSNMLLAPGQTNAAANAVEFFKTLDPARKPIIDALLNQRVVVFASGVKGFPGTPTLLGSFYGNYAIIADGTDLWNITKAGQSGSFALLENSWLARSFRSSLKFFGWWMAGDMAALSALGSGTTNRANEQIQNEMNKYPALKEASGNTDANTPRVESTQKINDAAPRNDLRGAMFVQPYLLFKPDLVGDKTRARLRVANGIIQLNNAVKEGNERTIEKNLKNLHNQILESINILRQNHQAEFSGDILASGLFADQEKQIRQILSSYEKKINDVMNGNLESEAKSAELAALSEQMMTELGTAKYGLSRLIVATQRQSIEEQFEQIRANLPQIKLDSYEDEMAQLQKRTLQRLDDTSSLAGAQQMEEINKVMNDYNSGLQSLLQRARGIQEKEIYSTWRRTFESEFAQVIKMYPTYKDWFVKEKTNSLAKLNKIIQGKEKIEQKAVKVQKLREDWINRFAKAFTAEADQLTRALAEAAAQAGSTSGLNGQGVAWAALTYEEKAQEFLNVAQADIASVVESWKQYIQTDEQADLLKQLQDVLNRWGADVIEMIYNVDLSSAEEVISKYEALRDKYIREGNTVIKKYWEEYGKRQKAAATAAASGDSMDELLSDPNAATDSAPH